MRNNKIPLIEHSRTRFGFPKLTSIAIALRVLPVLSSILILANVGALAQAEAPFFLEDFEDGNATDGNPVTWVPGNPFAAGSTGTVSNGSYVLTTTGASSVTAQEFPSIGDVSIRVATRGLIVGSGTYIGVFAHMQPDGRSYWAVVTQLGLHTGSGLPDGAHVIGTVYQPGAFDPSTGDVNIQFDVVGTKLSLTVWRPGSAKPSQPQLTSTASSLPPGSVGFATDYRQIAIRSFDAIRIGHSLPPRLSCERVGADGLRFFIPAGYVLQSSPSVDSSHWSDMEASGAVDVTASSPAKFFRLRSQTSLVSGDVLTIRQTWSQEPNGFDRTADVLVPSGEGPFPVIIALHGMGEDSGFVKAYLSSMPYFDNAIRVVPNGYLKCWNIDAEPSKAPTHRRRS